MNDLSYEGLMEHCQVASLIINELGCNPHTKHHIRAAIREASNKVTSVTGSSNKERAENMSIEAEKQMISGILSDLVADHTVPVSYLNSLVEKLVKPKPKDIANIVIKWSSMAVITKREDKRLKEMKLTKVMPDDWDGEDKLARYRVTRIELKPNRYKELLKKINQLEKK